MESAKLCAVQPYASEFRKITAIADATMTNNTCRISFLNCRFSTFGYFITNYIIG